MRIGIIAERQTSAEVLRRAVSQYASHEVLWTAAAAAEAMHRCANHVPDLVLVALPLAGMNGVDVIRSIMSNSPCPILIVTASVRASAAFVFDAMGQGALDAVDMPTLDAVEITEGEAALLAKIDTISRLIGEKPVSGGDDRRAPRAAPSAGRDLLVVIGASAGGPAALAAVLKGLPKEFPARIVIVQHVDGAFVGGMVEWLSQESGQRVSVAKEGERPAIGRVLVAGATGHLRLKTPERLGYTEEPRDYAYRPSVDVFFQSVSRLWRGDVVGVLLTGMGRDGALGLKALRDRGHYTIAQDESSCAVYGMPKAAAALNAAVDVLALDRIAARVQDVACASAAGSVRPPQTWRPSGEVL
jgi:two-component system, chemotaxis family, response regulator WspF